MKKTVMTMALLSAFAIPASAEDVLPEGKTADTVMTTPDQASMSVRPDSEVRASNAGMRSSNCMRKHTYNMM